MYYVWSVGFILGLITLKGVRMQNPDYFCTQFFKEIKSRQFLNFTLNDNSEEGTVLAEFVPPASDREGVYLVSPDAQYVGLHENKLVVQTSLRPKNGDTLILEGKCDGIVLTYNIVVPVDFNITVKINDVNDAPVISNLPQTIDVYENVTVGSVVFTVDVDDSYDQTDSFRTKELRVDRVTGLETSRPSPARTFYMTEGGQVRLVEKLDFEEGPRIYKVRILAKDGGSPPLSSTGRLVVRIKDVNDMPPKFTKENYMTRVIGEKPLLGKEECFNTTPIIRAHDQDRDIKSQIMYDIVEGEPGTQDYWGSYFRLEPSTGMLCQLNMVQRLLRDPLTNRDVFFNFTFTIRAYEAEDPSKADTAKLFIQIIDSNSASPTFDRRLYRVSLPEYPQTTSGADIITVTATDDDFGQNGEFAYSLIENPLDMFSIDPATGQITLVKGERFDREKKEFFEIKVLAKESKSAEQNEGSSRVLVRVIDVNDNIPTFSNSTYTYRIKDTLKTHKTIHQFDDDRMHDNRPSAYDADSGSNGRVRYAITEVLRQDGPTLFSDMGRFMMDPDTGAIKLAGSLKDLRRKKDYPVYKLIVSATDMPLNIRDRLSSTAEVFITIDKANDHKPRFGPPSNVGRTSSRNPGADGRYHIKEDVPIGTVVATVAAHDEDGDEDVFLEYTLSDGDDDDVFTINSVGRLSIRKQLDKEKQGFYKLTISVTDGQYNASTSVGVFVDDVNDNAPQFEKDEYEFHIDEEPSVGTVVGLTVATDLDQGTDGEITYSLKPGKGSDAFSMKKGGEIVTSKESQILDRELNDRIQLKVIATDSGEPPLTSSVDVIVYLNDLNDNQPVFSSSVYHGTVDEGGRNSAPQKVVMESLIKATDGDSTDANRNIRYSLNGDGSDRFMIDPRSAEVTVAQPGSLDSEETDMYHMKILATDKNGEGQASTSDLTIEIKDKNDNAPVFVNSLDINISGSEQVGNRIGQILAMDSDITEPNNRLIYILKNGGYGKFSVDLETGDIIVADAIDREPYMKEYELSIMAFDGGLPRQSNTTVVKIHVPINQKPTFNEETIHLKVDENMKAGVSPGKITAIDPDVEAGEQVLKYYLDSKEKVPFKVDKASGRLYTTSQLDYESQKDYSFVVYVRDDGIPSMSSSVSIDVAVQNLNDNPPSFRLPSYEGHIYEDNTDPNIGQTVNLPVNISVFDRDGASSVRVSLHGDHSNLFYIDEKTGLIRVSKQGAGRIDREKNERFELTLKATEIDHPTMQSEVDFLINVLDLNDNQPLFQPSTHELFVPEDIKVGQIIGHVTARDLDATSPNNDVIYTLESDPYGKFKVDLNTGDISVLSGLFFQPRQKTYILTVAAIDLGKPRKTTRTQVTVHVLKVNFNDYKPEVLGETIFFVREEVPLGHVVGVLEFVDEDLAPGQMVDLMLTSDWPVPFVIDSLTGEVRTSSRLDHDAGPHAYTFSVTAMDHGNPPKEAKINVGVIVEDINDNPPRFTQSEYHHRVATNFPAGTIVATPFAYDDIDVSTSNYNYHFEGDGSDVYFRIDPQTGLVTTTEQLQMAARDMFEFAVFATDIRKSDLVAAAKLRIDVQRTSDSGTC